MVACLLTTACNPGGGEMGVVLVVHSSERHQTWEGWEVTVNAYHRSDNPLRDQDRHPVDQRILDQMLDDAAFRLGITAIDTGIAITDERRSIEPYNDNDDPFVLADENIRWHWFDPYIRAVVLPLKRRVEDRGDRFTFSFRAVAWDSWQWDEPSSDPGEEYAEIMMAALERLRTRFGLIPDYVSIYNEPDNDSATETKQEVIRGATKLLARLEQAAYPTRLSFPDVSFVQNTLPWLDALVETNPRLARRLGMVTFHGYSAGFSGQAGFLHRLRSRTRLRAIRDRAVDLGLSTAQTEWWFTSDHPPDVITTLTEADVVRYQFYVLSGWANAPERGLYGITYSGGEFPLHTATGFVRAPDWHEVHQFANFIRPGDVRIATSSSSAAIRAVAFVKPDERHVVVILNTSDAPIAVEIHGLYPGTYATVVTDAKHQGEEVDRREAAAGGIFAVQASPQALLTVYGVRD